MLDIKLDDTIKKNVVEDIPIIEEIKDSSLREKVIDAWALSLQLNDFNRISEMAGSGMPEAGALGDQSMHINAVAYNSVSIYDNLCKAYKRDLGLDKDMLIACAVCHDIGKPYEYNMSNRKRWKDDVKRYGFPNLRHPAYGVYISITSGLPEEVVNVSGYHSPEGRFIKRSAYGTIVHYADDGSWFTLDSIFDLNIPKL